MSSKLSTSIVLLLSIGCCWCSTMPVINYDSQAFFCYSPLCLICINDYFHSEICMSCYEGYTLQDNKCILDSSLCRTSDGSKCTIPFCSQESVDTSGFHTCDICARSFELIISEQGIQQCQTYCYTTETYLADPSDCNTTCNKSLPSTLNCDKCQPNDNTSCLSCAKGYYFKNSLAHYHSYRIICVEQCGSGFYANSNYECVKCPPYCKECTSDTVCTSCNEVSLSTPAPSCQCPPGSYYFDHDCIKETPFNYLLINGQFQRLCQDGLYPLKQQNGSFLCTNANTYENKYCTSHLSVLKQLTSIEILTETYSEYLSFNLKMLETPKDCYDFQVTGLSDTVLDFSFTSNEIIVQQNYSPFIYSPRLKVKKSLLQDSQKVSCTRDSCILNLKVNWNKQTQLIYAINLDQSFKFELTNVLTYTSSPDQIDLICESCEIPNNLRAPSVLQINCQTGQVCSGDSMQVTAGSLIKVTQIVSDNSLKANKLQPHSIYQIGFEIPGNFTKYFTQLIKDYTFDNSIPGQITYSFYAIQYPQIQVGITSYLKNTKTPGGRMLTASSETVNYPQMHFQINVVIPSNDESKIGSYIGIGVGVGVVVALLGGFLVFYIRRIKKTAKNATQLPAKEIIIVTEEQGLQLENAKRFDSEPIQEITPKM